MEITKCSKCGKKLRVWQQVFQIGKGQILLIPDGLKIDEAKLGGVPSEQRLYLCDDCDTVGWDEHALLKGREK